MGTLPVQQVDRLTDKDIQTLEQAGIIPPNTPKAQVEVFGQICKERGLSAFSKEIHLVGYAGRYSVIVGINGFRKIAAESGLHVGTDDVVYDLMPNGSYKTAAELKAAKSLPTSATCTVYRAVGGIKAAFTHTVLFSEFSTGKNKWQEMPFQMIAKVAEAFALRKGFSDRLTGLHVEEERGVLESSGTTPKAAPLAQKDDMLAPALAEKYVEVKDAVMSFVDFKELLAYWVEFAKSEYGAMEPFVDLFFQQVATVATSVSELSEFHKTIGKWAKFPNLVKILSSAKHRIESNGTGK